MHNLKSGQEVLNRDYGGTVEAAVGEKGCFTRTRVPLIRTLEDSSLYLRVLSDHLIQVSSEFSMLEIGWDGIFHCKYIPMQSQNGRFLWVLGG